MTFGCNELHNQLRAIKKEHASCDARLEDLAIRYARSLAEFGDEEDLNESEQSDEEISLEGYPEDVRMLCADDDLEYSFKWHLANSAISKRLTDA